MKSWLAAMLFTASLDLSLNADAFKISGFSGKDSFVIRAFSRIPVAEGLVLKEKDNLMATDGFVALSCKTGRVVASAGSQLKYSAASGSPEPDAVPGILLVAGAALVTCNSPESGRIQVQTRTCSALVQSGETFMLMDKGATLAFVCSGALSLQSGDLIKGPSSRPVQINAGQVAEVEEPGFPVKIFAISEVKSIVLESELGAKLENLSRSMGNQDSKTMSEGIKEASRFVFPAPLPPSASPE